MSTITPREPDSGLLSYFFTPSLRAAPAYHIDIAQAPIKLDQNESPWDWPQDVKQSILHKLQKTSWNRYPNPFADDLVQHVAKDSGVPPECVLLGPGSNYLLTILITALARHNEGKVVVARPSFALYEVHLQYEGIPYEIWPLSSDLEYDTKLMPELPPGSTVFFASPNNPVGNSLSKKTLQALLKQHPETMFVADEAYYEFADENFTDLLAQHDNMVIVRTFSKSLAAAAVRLGFILGSKAVIHELKKLRVPYLLNPFVVLAAEEILTSQTLQAEFHKVVEDTKKERRRLFEFFQRLSGQGEYTVRQSHANFLLLRWPTNEPCHKIYRALMAQGILVRNVSGAPSLSGCLRITVGTSSENDQLMNIFAKIIGA